MTKDRHTGMAPSPWIERYAHLVKAGGRVLDVAAGHGRHARLFVGLGMHVVAADRDAVALADIDASPRLTTQVVDLETGTWPFGGQTFDGIVVANYLHRPLLPHLIGALAQDGVLLYETFAAGNAIYGRPGNPEFLLREGELLGAVRGKLAVVAFEQGLVRSAGGCAVVQRIAAVGQERAWPAALTAT